MDYFINVMKNYATFSGRARRSEYWYFYLFYAIFIFLAMIIDFVIGGEIFYILFVLATFIPSLAVSIRRLHDVGKSGWFILIGFIPIIGSIWLLVLFVTDSQNGANQYGLNPKEIYE